MTTIDYKFLFQVLELLVFTICFFKPMRNLQKYTFSLAEKIADQEKIILHLDERLSYIHQVFFTNLQTINNKLEWLESELHQIQMYFAVRTEEKETKNENVES